MTYKKIWNTGRQFLILLITLFLIASCGRKSEIEGTWIGTAFNISERRPGFVSIQPVVYITPDSLFYRTVGYEEGLFEKVDSFTTSYNLDKKILHLKKSNKKIALKYLSKDSIVAHYADDPSYQMSFNRIVVDNDFMNFGDLVHQEFLFQGLDDAENSIYFVNDSLAIEYHKESDVFDIKKWESVNFKKQKFLVLSNPIRSVSLHLDSVSHGALHLSRYSGAKNFAFKKLKESDSLKRKLLGDWYFDRVMDSTNSSMWVLNRLKKYHTLNFSGTYVNFKELDTNKRKRFLLTQIGKLLIFPDEEITNSRIWKIEKITDHELHLTHYAHNGEFLIKIRYLKATN